MSLNKTKPYSAGKDLPDSNNVNIPNFIQDEGFLTSLC